MFVPLGWNTTVQTVLPISGGVEAAHLRPRVLRDPGGQQRGHGLHDPARPPATVLRPGHQPPVPDAANHPGLQPRLLPPGLHRPQRHRARRQWDADLRHDAGGCRADPGHHAHHHRLPGNPGGPRVQHQHLP